MRHFSSIINYIAVFKRKLENTLTLLFSEKEWSEAMPSLTDAMTTYLQPFRTGVFEHFTGHEEEWGEGWGSGSYLRLGDRVYVLTNMHVSTALREGRQLTYLFGGQGRLRPFTEVFAEATAPFDFGLLPVDMSDWSAVGHSSKAIAVDQIALSHEPVEREIFAFSGFAGENVSFNFSQLNSQAICYLCQETEVPMHPEVDRKVHFSLDYNPNLATSVKGGTGLPTPPGLSGSAVWDTGFVKARMMRKTWTPEMARVTGVVWGWPSGAGSIIATRAEHLHSFLSGTRTED